MISVNESSLSSIQLSAMSLYQYGLNVFPVPRPQEVNKLAELYPGKFYANTKIPYILEPLFYSRMHFCDETCKSHTIHTFRLCPGNRNGTRFQDLFVYANIGVILGRTSGNLVCIDCNSHKAFDLVVNRFDLNDLDYWAYQTSRGGNLLFQLLEGEAKNMSSSPIPEVEIWGNKHFCVLPPSVHPSGVVYTWINGLDPSHRLRNNFMLPCLNLEQLAWLGIQVKDRSIKHGCDDHPDLPIWTQYLSINNRKILCSQLIEGERNQQLTKAVYDIAAVIEQGFTSYDEGLEVLLWTSSRCVPPYPHGEIRKMLASALRKKDLVLAKDYENPNKNTSKYLSIIQKAELFLYQYDWRTHGRTALTDRAVFEACIKRAHNDRSNTFRASSRETAELANIQKPNTVINSMTRLINKGLLKKVGRDNSGANTFCFGDTVLVPDRYTITSLNTSVPFENGDFSTQFSPDTSIEQDLFSKLGRMAFPIWEYLKQNPKSSPSVIAEKLHLNRSSVSKALSRLRTYGLINFSEAEGIYTGNTLLPEDIEILAEELGTFGRSKKRTEHFKHDARSGSIISWLKPEIDLRECYIQKRSRLDDFDFRVTI